MPGGTVLRGGINSNGVPQSEYKHDMLTSVVDDAKMYLRRFRSSTDASIWHETIENNVYRLCTGTTDAQEELVLRTGSYAKFAGEIISKSANGLRIAYGNYGFFIRNDGSSTYFMLTASGDNLGTWNSLRPLTINNANGAVSIGNGLTVYGSVGLGTANALGGNSIVLGDNDTGLKQNGDGILDVYANSQRVFRFKNDAAFSLKKLLVGDSKTFSLSSSNTSTKNVTFNLWGASTRPVVAELGDDSGWHFYSQRNTDNSIIFAVNGQVSPSNYSNFDSRYALKTACVTSVRLGAYKTHTMQKGKMFETAGYVITGLGIIGEVDGDDPARLRPLQYCINGTWYTAATA